jgi:urease accessory protein
MASVIELMLADSRTPTGGYAHSGGLEAAVNAGLGIQEIASFVRGRLRTVAFVDAAITAASTKVTTVEDLLALDLEWAARTPAPPLRTAGRQLGLALLRVARAWWPADELIADYERRSDLFARPVVLGVVAGVAGIDALRASQLSMYEDAAAVFASAVKLLPVDTAVVSSMLAAMAGELEELAIRAAASGLDASTSTPLLEIRALTHANQQRRLFAS